ncbi:TlpA disulfide reductase family protein [Riemerella anatipestifer]|uniref:TlpA family protein disulfide reductase n=1 Tax=Riemerella anatipestifer TaxID=34085 RepID=UPI00129D8B63|nr:TlpA disulfide reductase family protein [Riemerella anatipestifer]MRM83996.1 TlpA family protein disulfide reductase [Riemerella anatipestifer]
MNDKLKFLFFGLLVLVWNHSFAQSEYYRVNGKNPIDKSQYSKLKEVYLKRGEIEEILLKTETKKDSIVKYVKIGNIGKTPDGKDPYAETRKFIGRKFPIAKLKNKNSKALSEKIILGKPTLINFWFTKCPPCISEIPSLQKLKEKFGDRVNFISVTFENQKSIDDFVKKYKYDYKHIPNSKNQIDELGIEAYPTNIILDKNGIIKIVRGEISEYNIKDIETTLNILL